MFSTKMFGILNKGKSQKSKEMLFKMVVHTHTHSKHFTNKLLIICPIFECSTGVSYDQLSP